MLYQYNAKNKSFKICKKNYKICHTNYPYYLGIVIIYNT